MRTQPQFAQPIDKKEEKALPGEITRINNILEGYIKSLEEVHSELTNNAKPRTRYYSEAKLNAELKTTPDETKKLLNQIQEQADIYKQFIQANKVYWQRVCQEQLDREAKKRDELAKAKSSLLHNLQQFQQHLDEDKKKYDEAKHNQELYRKATDAFIKIRERAERMMFRSTPDETRREYEQFCKDYGSIAKLDDFNDKCGLYAKCTPLVSMQLPAKPLVLPRIPVAEELKLKSTGDLKQIATKTKDAALVEQFSQLQKLQDLADQKNITPTIKVDDLKQDDDLLCKSLVLQASIVSKNYVSAKTDLYKQSKALFESIEKQVASVREEVEKTRLALNALHQIFKTSVSARQLKQALDYDKLKAQYKYALDVCHNASEQMQAIVENYRKVCSNFDVKHVGWEEQSKHQITSSIKTLNDELKGTKALLVSSRESVEGKKFDLIAAELINCFRYMIRDRVMYWRKQVVSSQYYIGNTMVPHGIADMNLCLEKLDRKEINNWQAIKAIKDIADARSNAWKGWFYKRALQTTDKFYGVVKGIVLDGLSLDSLKTLKNGFEAIPGLVVKREPAVLPPPPPPPPRSSGRRPPPIKTRR